MIMFHVSPRTARRRLLGPGAALSAQRPACLLEAMSRVRDRACVCRPDDRSAFPSRAGALDQTDYSPNEPVAKQVSRRLQLNRHVSAPLLIHSLGPAPFCHFLPSHVCSFLLRWTTKNWIAFDGEKRRACIGFHHEFLMTPIRRAIHHDGDRGMRRIAVYDANGLRHGTFRRSASQENPRDKILDVAHPHPARATCPGMNAFWVSPGDRDLQHSLLR